MRGDNCVIKYSFDGPAGRRRRQFINGIPAFYPDYCYYVLPDDQAPDEKTKRATADG